MDCKKQEAIMAIGQAEMKMQNNGFIEARKILLHAQQLCPELDNLTHLLAVCDVHCSAQNNVNLSLVDWYGVLNVAQTADEITIKKQYRKLALLLHPDKNKFPGAEMAFKLIVDANTLLTDPEKRSVYDKKMKATFRVAPCIPAAGNAPSGRKGRPSGVRATPSEKKVSKKQEKTKMTSGNKGKNPASQGSRNQMPSKKKKDVSSNKKLREEDTVTPRKRSKKKTANDVNNGIHKTNESVLSSAGQEIGADSKTRTEQDLQRNSVCSAGDALNDGLCGVAREIGVHRKASQQSSDQGSSTKQDVSSKKNLRAENITSPRKRSKKKTLNDRDDVLHKSNDSVGSSLEQNSGAGNKSRREKDLQKSNVSSAGDVFNDSLCVVGRDIRVRRKASIEKVVASNAFCTSRHAKGSKQSTHCLLNDEIKHSDTYSGDVTECNPRTQAETPDARIGGKYFTVADTEFYDFQKDKEDGCFATGQIWAAYDTTADCMPRLYARIEKLRPLEMTLLDPDPDDQEEINWLRRELPVACGKYKHGETTGDVDPCVFSHKLQIIPINTKSYVIYPRKGQTWAVYKNYNRSWSSKPVQTGRFDVEIVEVVSDMTESGVVVAFLDKVKGFASVFRRRVEGLVSFKVTVEERFRFSHRIPSVTLAATGAPDDSLELDPAALPRELVGRDSGG